MEKNNQNRDIYQVDRKKLISNLVIKLENSGEDYLDDFLLDLKADGLSDARIVKILIFLNQWKEKKLINCTFPELNDQVFKKAKIALQSCELAEWSKKDYCIILSKLMQWLKKKNLCKLQDFELLKFKVKKGSEQPKDNVLTLEDVVKLSESAYNLRDRLLPIILFESGLRIAELLNIKLKNIDVKPNMVVLNISGKTGARSVYLIKSIPSLMTYLDNRKNKEPEDYLFETEGRRTRVSYACIKKALRMLGQRANIDKRINPHFFRHSGATELSSKMTASELKLYFGWTKLETASTYIHLSGQQLQDKILSINGLIPAPEVANPFKKCPRCETLNDFYRNRCMKCQYILDLRGFKNAEAEDKIKLQIIEELLSIPEKRQKYLEMIRKRLEEHGY